jgi:hypothetical protein
MTTAFPSSSKLEMLLGRSLAACAHPYAAWRLGARGRVPLLVGYFLAGYLLIFLTLAALPGLS